MNNPKDLKYYDDKSNLTSMLVDFIKLCEEIGRDSEEEIEDIIADAKRDS